MKDLSEIYGPDINSPTQLIMSGVESDAYWDIAVGAGFDRLLVSYHYIQRKGKKWLRERMEKHPNIKLMIDSGAYTFHVNEEEYKNKPVSFFEDYVKRYVKWIKDNKDIIFSCVEVDIANLVGFDKVDEFRRDYFEPLKEEGILVCYVWHEFDGKPHWEEMCKKYDYVGFSMGTGALTEPDAIRMVNIAKRYNARVHGFAVTRIELMSRVPFYTGDSTTWLVGTQYGELNWFDGRKMRRLKKKDWKTLYKPRYIKLGANWDLAEKENPYELIRINALVFKEAEKFVIKRVRPKMYWLKDKSLSAIGGGKKDLSKKLIGRKKPAAQEEVVEEQPKKKKLKIKKKTSKVVKEKAPEKIPEWKITPTEEVEEKAQTIDRPKTKFEEFEEMSKGAEKVIYPLEEQIAKLPPVTWVNGEAEEYKELAKSIHFDISNLSKDEFLDIVYNFCVFLRDTDELEGIEDEQLFDIAKFLLNKSINDRSEAISLLTDFYSKNLTGERTDLVGEVSEYNDEAPPMPTERESYLEDEEFEMVDVSEQEMMNYLPAPSEDGSMPEVDEIDKELAKGGIVAVRDENGRFVKGQKRVRKPKQLYSKHFPKLACNTCYKAGECPMYKPDHACAYDKIFKKFKTRNMDDLLDAMHGMADFNLERMQRLMMFETMDGGMADPTLTGMIDQNLNIMMKMKQLHEAKAQIVATQRRTLHADGSEVSETTVSNPSGGILAQIFGMPSKEEDDRDIIDVTPEEEEKDE